MSNSNKRVNDNENDSKLQENENKNETLFESIQTDVLTNELNIHKEYLRNELIELQTKFKSQFKQLKNNIKEYNLGKDNEISQNELKNRYFATIETQQDFMSELGILPFYKSREMPYDNISGFNGKNEYDFNGYLTQLLIASHQIIPIFQKECKKYFVDYFRNKLNIDCEYSSAPVKTRARSILKAKLDYKNKEWPLTSNIIDVVRCSVSFNDIKHFLDAFNRFRAQFDHKSIANNKGCIKAIVRIKNDFIDISDDISAESLQNINYSDIKVNVLIEYNNKRIIGEIQFLLNIFLNFKKRQHSIYSFIRNAALYNSLFNLQYNNSNKNKNELIYNGMRKYVLSRNISEFSFYMQSLTLVEKDYILKDENRDKILKLMKENEWRKGIELFSAIVEKLKQTQS